MFAEMLPTGRFLPNSLTRRGRMSATGRSSGFQETLPFLAAPNHPAIRPIPVPKPVRDCQYRIQIAKKPCRKVVLTRPISAFMSRAIPPARLAPVWPFSTSPLAPPGRRLTAVRSRWPLWSGLMQERATRALALLAGSWKAVGPVRAARHVRAPTSGQILSAGSAVGRTPSTRQAPPNWRL